MEGLNLAMRKKDLLMGKIWCWWQGWELQRQARPADLVCRSVIGPRLRMAKDQLVLHGRKPADPADDAIFDRDWLHARAISAWVPQNSSDDAADQEDLPYLPVSLSLGNHGWRKFRCCPTLCQCIIVCEIFEQDSCIFLILVVVTLPIVPARDWSECVIHMLGIALCISNDCHSHILVQWCFGIKDEYVYEIMSVESTQWSENDCCTFYHWSVMFHVYTTMRRLFPRTNHT